MNAELQLYRDEIARQLDRLLQGLAGLSEAQLNWRPPAPEANSPYVIVTHTLGNLEAWVLGIACGRRMRRDRAAEFRSSGPDAAALAGRARDLAAQFDAAFAALPDGALDEPRDPPAELWGLGPPRPITVRDALMHTIEHAATHAGELMLTRDLAQAGAPM